MAFQFRFLRRLSSVKNQFEINQPFYEGRTKAPSTTKTNGSPAAGKGLAVPARYNSTLSLGLVMGHNYNFQVLYCG